jgi:hypothetical protein
LLRKNGIQGKVFVTFVVGKDGSVSNAKVTVVLTLRWIKKHCAWLTVFLNGNRENKEVSQYVFLTLCQSALFFSNSLILNNNNPGSVSAEPGFFVL